MKEIHGSKKSFGQILPQRTAWRIFSNWSGAFENSLSFSLIVCQTICKLSCNQFFLGRPTLLWSTSNGAAELLRKLTILIGRLLFCRKIYPTNDFDIAARGTIWTEWFVLAPGGLPVSSFVGRFQHLNWIYQYKSWPCPIFSEVLSVGML